MSNTTNSSNMNNHVSPLSNFKPKEICLYNMVNKFYHHCDRTYIDKMVKIVNTESEISLRILDWFVTKYSNRKKISIDVDDSTEDETIDVHISYKAQLKSYKKRYFDPFKRRSTFDYKFKGTVHSITTTLGQLNFFRWAIENKILDYVETNYETITIEMNASNKNDKKKKKAKSIKQMVIPQKGTRGNNIIGINVSKKVNDDEDVKITLSFD